MSKSISILKVEMFLSISRLVVDEVDNPDAQISLIDVQKLGFTDVEVNEYVRIENLRTLDV